MNDINVSFTLETPLFAFYFQEDTSATQAKVRNSSWSACTRIEVTGVNVGGSAVNSSSKLVMSVSDSYITKT